MSRLINVKYDGKQINLMDQETVGIVVNDVKEQVAKFDPEAVVVFTPFDFQEISDDDLMTNIDIMINILAERGYTDWIADFTYRLGCEYQKHENVSDTEPDKNEEAGE